MDSVKFDVKYIEVDPKTLKLLDVNARYMDHDQFSQLVSNIKADGKLTSTPFAWLWHDDDTKQPILNKQGGQVYEVLSGNHRVQASIVAEFETIHLLATDNYLSPDQRLAIQLSHNSITGQDDIPTLQTIYAQIKNHEFKLYSGLDDKQLDLMADSSTMQLSIPRLDFQRISMMFLPHEIEHVNNIVEDLEGFVNKSDQTWLLPFSQYDEIMDVLQAGRDASGVRNMGTSMLALLGIVERHIGDLRELYTPADGESADPRRRAPVEAIFGMYTIPAKVAVEFRRSIDYAMARLDKGTDEPQLLEVLMKMSELTIEHYEALNNAETD